MQDDSIRSDIEEAIGRFEGLRAELVEVRGEDVTGAVMELLPSMIYFDEMDQLTDSTDLTTFLGDRTKFKTLDNLLHLADLNVEKLGGWAEYRRRLATEQASAVITGLVNESWRQEKVQVRIGVDGPKLIVFVQDEAGGFDPPSRRSKGFQWFLAFYINFIAGSNRELKNTILLLDDPGVYLHPGGQRDLLRTLEKISGGNQVVFSTHLPFMIHRDHLERVRIVHKEKNEVGTVVKHKFWESDFDALEPIRAAIGLSIGDALASTKKNLLVEGYSDNLILEGMSVYCKRAGKKWLNTSRISIWPVAGAAKMPFFALFLQHEGLKWVALLDNDQLGRKVAKQLKEDYGLDARQVLLLNEVISEHEKGVELELEDLIEESFYNTAVNEAYKDILQGKLEDGKITLDDLDSSIRKHTKRYGQFFKDNKLGTFDKTLVARQIRYLASDSACTEDKLGKETVDNFDSLFGLVSERLR